MSKINNLKESWNNHTFKEVENCIKEAFEAADNKVDSIAKLNETGTIIDVEDKRIANVRSIGAVSEGGFAGSIEQAHTVFIGGIDLDDTPIRNVDEIDAQSANIHEVNADNIKTKTINITGTKPPTGRLKVVTSRVESEGESENVDLITYDANNHNLNIGAEIQGAKVNVHGTINGDNGLHITGGAVLDETLHVEEGAYVGENLEVGEDLIMRAGAIITDNGALALPKDKSNRETLAVRSDLTSLFDSVDYDSNNKTILFKHGDTTLKTLNAAPFIKDGMVSNVAVVGNNIVISFNTDSGKEDIEIPITSIFDPDAYVAKRVYNSVAEMEADTDIKNGTIARVKGELKEFTFDPSKLPSITPDDYQEIDVVKVIGGLKLIIASNGPGYWVAASWNGGGATKGLYASYYGEWPTVVFNLIDNEVEPRFPINDDFGILSDCVSDLTYDNELYYYENGWVKMTQPSSSLVIPIIRGTNPETGEYTYTNVTGITSKKVNDKLTAGISVQYVLYTADINNYYARTFISTNIHREYRGYPAFVINFAPQQDLSSGLTLGHNMNSVGEERGGYAIYNSFEELNNASASKYEGNICRVSKKIFTGVTIDPTVSINGSGYSGRLPITKSNYIYWYYPSHLAARFNSENGTDLIIQDSNGLHFSDTAQTYINTNMVQGEVLNASADSLPYNVSDALTFNYIDTYDTYLFAGGEWIRIANTANIISFSTENDMKKSSCAVGTIGILESSAKVAGVRVDPTKQFQIDYSTGSFNITASNRFEYSYSGTFQITLNGNSTSLAKQTTLGCAFATEAQTTIDSVFVSGETLSSSIPSWLSGTISIVYEPSAYYTCVGNGVWIPLRADTPIMDSLQGNNQELTFDSNNNIVCVQTNTVPEVTKLTIPVPASGQKTVAMTDELFKGFTNFFTHVIVFNGLNANSCTLYTSNGSETISTAGRLKNKLPTASTMSYNSCLVIIKSSQVLYGDCYIGKVYDSSSQYGINSVIFICSNFVNAQMFSWREGEPLQKKYKTIMPYSQYSDLTLATITDIVNSKNRHRVIFNGTTFVSQPNNIEDIELILYNDKFYHVCSMNSSDVTAVCETVTMVDNAHTSTKDYISYAYTSHAVTPITVS